jgi:hypothetical protein
LYLPIWSYGHVCILQVKIQPHYRAGNDGDIGIVFFLKASSWRFIWCFVIPYLCLSPFNGMRETTSPRDEDRRETVPLASKA